MEARLHPGLLSLFAVLAGTNHVRAAEESIDIDSLMSAWRADRDAVASIEEQVERLGRADLEGLLTAIAAATDSSTSALRDDELTELVKWVARLGREPVLTGAGRALSGPVESDRRLHLRLLGEVGVAADLDAAIDIALDAEGSISRSEARSLELCMASIFERDEDAFRRLRALVLDQTPRVAAVLIGASAAGDPATGVETFFDLLGFSAELDPLLLEKLGAWARSSPSVFDPSRVEALREKLWDSNERIVREAALLLGRLEDYEAVPILIELLDDGRPAVPPMAHFALRKLTELGFAAESPRWRVWYQAESAWLQEEAQFLFDDLDGGDSPAIARALCELAEHRISRPELARRVVRVLLRSEPELRRKACIALRTLGGVTEIDALMGLATDPDARVVAEARSTLSRIVQIELPPDPAEWEAHLPRPSRLERTP